MNDKSILRYPTALTIAGSDSGGGAGIQADLKTFSAIGVFGTSAITAITAQNTLGVKSIQAVSPEILRDQIEAVFDDFTIDTVKIGMLHDTAIIDTVANTLRARQPRVIILDPVMISTSGSKLLKDEAIEALIERLFPLATLLTPNVHEAEYLAQCRINGVDDIEQAATRLLSLGCPTVLMKGGHLAGEKNDWLFRQGEETLRFTAPDIPTRNTHGTGCTLSSAIAAYMALGESLETAIALAKQYVTSALKAGADIIAGHGHGPMNHFFQPVPLRAIQQDEP